MIRIPKGFYDTHVELGTAVPPLLKTTFDNYWIDEGHEAMAGLIDDAEDRIDPWRDDELNIHVVIPAMFFLRSVQKGRVGGYPSKWERARTSVRKPSIRDLVKA